MQIDMDIKIEGGALEELYLRHAPEALRLAFLLTGDRQLAQDLVQDAFVRLAGRLLHVRSPAGFHAYLRTTIVNLVRSHARRKAVEARFVQRNTSTRPLDPPDVSERDQLRRALMGLPVRQRTAVVLRFYEDLSVAQTADLMRCRPGSVRSLSARGIRSLRTSLGED